MHNHFHKTIKGLTVEGEFLPALMSVRVTVIYEKLILVNNKTLDENDSSYPFAHPCGSEYAARGLLSFCRECNSRLMELTVSLAAPVQESFTFYADKPPDPHPDPEPSPSPPAPSVEMEIRASRLKYQDLFPYIYIRPWPQISEYDRRTRFIAYDKDSGADPIFKAFYNALTAEMEEPSARSAMETEAIAFIEGKNGKGSPPPSYKGQFVPDIDDFKTIMGAYLKCWIQLHQFEVITYDELEAVVLENIGDWDTVKEDIEKQDYKDEKERTWESFFALTITLGYDYTLLDRLIKTLVTAKLVEIAAFRLLSDEEVSRMANATIILPNEIFPLQPAQKPALSSSPPPTPPTQWLKPYAVGHIQMVRYRLRRYEFGEVSLVENILKGECKEVTRRKLNRLQSTVTNEEQQAAEKAHELDGTTTDLLNEIGKTLYSKTVNTTYNENGGGKSIGGWTVEDGPSGGHWENSAKFAKEVVARTAERIRKKVSLTRSFSTLNETEETVVHRFDNTTGDRNIRGIYRWVNKIYAMRTINCGDRLVVEIKIDKPASAFSENERQYHDITFKAPVHPKELGLLDYRCVSRHSQKKDGSEPNPLYYLDLLEAYDVRDSVPPPPKPETVTIVLESIKPFSTADCVIPEGYRARKAFVSITFNRQNDTAEVIVGKEKAIYPPTTDGGSYSSPPVNGGILTIDLLDSDSQCSRLPVSVMCRKQPGDNGSNSTATKIETDYSQVTAEVDTSAGPPQSMTVSSSDDYYIANVEIRCEPERELVYQWKYKTYLKIIEGYKKEQDEYYLHMDKQNREISSANQKVNREIEKQQIKMKCISLLRDIYAHLVVGKVGTGNEEVSQMEINEPRYLQFFENVMEWDKMTYYLYPDYGNRENYNIDYSGTDFGNFLRAERARVLLPVKHERSLIFLFFLMSGMIWPCPDNLAPTTDTGEKDMYLSLVNELKALSESCPIKEKPIVEEWDVTIPTSMVVLQENSQFPEFKEYKE